MSQMHVEVAVERLKQPLRRRGRPAPAARARTSRRSARRRGRGTATRSRPAAAASSATATSCSSRCEGHEGYEFVDKIVGGVIPQSFRPAVDKGIQEAMQHGELAGAPVQGVTRAARRRPVPQRRLLGDGVQDRRLDGVQGRPTQKADPVLLEPIMSLEVTVPDDDGGRGQRRPQLAARPPARDGARAAA